MNTLFKTLALIGNAAFSGAFLLVAVAIVPFWKTLSDTDLNSWFDTFFWRFPTIMIPLNLIAFIAIASGFFYTRKEGGALRKKWLGALACIFLCSITYPIFFDGANQVLSGAVTPAKSIASTLDGWGNWHLLRTALSLLSLGIIATIPTPNT
ncbi:hypothetical protein [Maribacter sp. 2-571]|uniref:hypothetical protein n=1 Tax=Maribacter sp. 2-571 TaxID=3417569 RepID=UPI003D353DD0